jgi:cell division transport system ATP-binding protein
LASQFGQTNRILVPQSLLFRLLWKVVILISCRSKALSRALVQSFHPVRWKAQSGQYLATRRNPDGPQGNAVITFENVAYSYGGGELLSDVSLRLAPGSFHFLTGPSGAGKSTFLKLAYAELRPTTGRVTLFDRDVITLSRDDVARSRRRIGIVHQDCKFLDHLSLAANMALPFTVSDRESDRQDMDDLLGWVGLKHLADALPPQLSGGERQRAALARAVIVDPDVILADEPTGNVDWEMSLRILTLLVELNRMGKTVLVATHDLNLIRQAKAQIQARVLRIAKHRIQLAGADL